MAHSRLSRNICWVSEKTYTHTHTHTLEYYSAIKKNEICSNMGGPRDYHTKWSKPDKDKYRMISLICGI